MKLMILNRLKQANRQSRKVPEGKLPLVVPPLTLPCWDDIGLDFADKQNTLNAEQADSNEIIISSTTQTFGTLGLGLFSKSSAHTNHL